MDQPVADQALEADKRKEPDVAVAVLTPKGIYPDRTNSAVSRKPPSSPRC